jgi:hypothetical protein
MGSPDIAHTGGMRLRDFVAGAVTVAVALVVKAIVGGVAGLVAVAVVILAVAALRWRFGF